MNTARFKRLLAGAAGACLFFAAHGCKTQPESENLEPATRPGLGNLKTNWGHSSYPEYEKYRQNIVTQIVTQMVRPKEVEPPTFIPPDGTVYSFRAQDIDIQSALSIFAQANNLNIVPDPAVTGKVTVDLRNLSLNRLMQALLEAHGYYWTFEDGLIRVRAFKTESFTIDYIRLIRSGQGRSDITVASTSQQSYGRGYGGTGGGSAAGTSATGAGGSDQAAQIQVKQQDSVDFWKELEEQLNAIKSSEGKVMVNKMSGKIVVTDRLPVLKRIRAFLEDLSDSIHRQVEIEARMFVVTLSDTFSFGVNWRKLFKDMDVELSADNIVGQPFGGESLKVSNLQFHFIQTNTDLIVKALSEQGQVDVISQPRIRALNNQTALIKVGTDRPFFVRSSDIVTSQVSPIVSLNEQIQVVTEGTVLSITPQISAEGWITLDICPVITRLVDVAQSPPSDQYPNGGGSTAPVLDIKQASSLVRVRSGETILIAGLIQDELSDTTRKTPGLGDVPGVGKVFRGNYRVKQKKELVIFVTPVLTP